MFDFVIKVIFWIFCIYGLLSVIHDFINYNTYKKVNENIKLILFVKNVEDGIEQYIKELAFGGNFFNNLIVIDENSNDDTYAILHNLELAKISNSSGTLLTSSLCEDQTAISGARPSNKFSSFWILIVSWA